MTPVSRYATLALALSLAVFAAWRIAGQMQAERYATAEPSRALRWRPDDPTALLAVAEARLHAGDPEMAQVAAHRLLAHEPLQGEAFRILAGAADRQGDREKATRLYRVAERRAPRDLQARAWLTQRYLERADYAAALAEIDRILRMAPLRMRSIGPVLVKLSREQAFAEELATALRSDPPWRPGVLAALRAPKGGDPLAAGKVMQALQDQGGLSADEYASWLDSLMVAGRWGEAYARWAGSVARPGGRLPLVYNGDFEQPVSDAGFDWRQARVPGVLLRFEQVPGTSGQAAYIRFLGRRVPDAGLRQPMLLSPGVYLLTSRVRGQGLRSALGLQWVVACTGKGGIRGRSDPIDGGFDWKTVSMAFDIPSTGCQAQWLRLVNPVPGGAAQQVSGELWVDDVKVVPRSR